MRYLKYFESVPEIGEPLYTKIPFDEMSKLKFIKLDENLFDRISKFLPGLKLKINLPNTDPIADNRTKKTKRLENGFISIEKNKMIIICVEDNYFLFYNEVGSKSPSFLVDGFDGLDQFGKYIMRYYPFQSISWGYDINQ